MSKHTQKSQSVVVVFYLRIVWLRRAEQRLDREQGGRYRQNRRPLLLENIQADDALQNEIRTSVRGFCCGAFLWITWKSLILIAFYRLGAHVRMVHLGVKLDLWRLEWIVYSEWHINSVSCKVFLRAKHPKVICRAKWDALTVREYDIDLKDAAFVGCSRWSYLKQLQFSVSFHDESLPPVHPSVNSPDVAVHTWKST